LLLLLVLVLLPGSILMLFLLLAVAADCFRKIWKLPGSGKYGRLMFQLVEPNSLLTGGT
jgi:hypothetical protein